MVTECVLYQSGTYAPAPAMMSQLPTRKSGFALVIALSLMAFVVLLLLSMTTLVQVETQNADQSKKQLAARANAMTGLMVAVGRLQQYAGPDQRATATAEILDSVPDLTRLNVQNPHWTGVWKADANFDPDDPTTNPNPELMTWLVSGMQDYTTENELEDQIEVDMQVNTPSGPTAANRARLVAPTIDGNGNPSGGVAVPTEPIDQSGTFAYWIADEGVKASVGLVDPLFGEAKNDSEQASRVTVGQRFGIEQMGSGQSALAGLFDVDAPFDRATDVSSVSLASNNQTEAQSRLPRLQHDLTLRSLGLPINTVDGGFKVDLSRGLDDDLLTGDIYTSLPSSPSWDDKLIPQWGKLRSYFQGAPSGSVPVSAPTNTTQGYHPLLLQSRVVSGIHLESMGLNSDDEDTFRVDMVFAVIFSLWNPYNVELAAADYVFDTSVAPDGDFAGFGFEIEFAEPPAGNGLGTPISTFGGRTYSEDLIKAATGDPDAERVRFATKESISFQPGEVLVLSTQPGSDGSENDYVVGSNNQEWYAGLPEGAKCVEVGISEWEYIRIPGRATDIVTASEIGLTLLTDDPANPGEKLSIDAGGSGSVYFHVKNVGSLGMNVYTASGIALSSLNYGVGVGNQNNFVVGGQLNLGVVKPAKLAAGHRISPRSSRSKIGFRNLADFNLREIPDPDNIGVAQRNRDTSFNLWGWNQNAGAASFVHGSNPAEKNGIGYMGLTFSSDVDADPVPSILFDAPSEAPISLGQLQHANLVSEWYAPAGNYAGGGVKSPYDSQIPSFQIGNSRASMFMPVAEPDFVYRVNHALWDDYFFSSAPRNVDFADPLPNPRVRFVDDAETRPGANGLIADRDRAGELLMIDGAFNVNSTSVDAWKAVFSNLGGVIQNNDTAGALEAPFPSLLSNVQSHDTVDNIFTVSENHLNYEDLHPDEGGTSEIAKRVYNGYRNLTETEIQALAERMVEEVKVRGPFISLAQFVNRTLSGDLDPRARGSLPSGNLNHGEWVADQRDTRLKGTLQAAIDGAAIEGGLDHNGDAPDINEIVRLADFDPSLGDSLTGNASPSDEAQGVIGLGSMGSVNPASNAINSNASPFSNKLNRPQDVVTGMNINSDDIAQNPWIAGYGLASTDAPGYLSQMDILSAIAPFISVRSDTFKVRAYGNYTDPITGAVESETWLEATVQRRHEYVDSNNSPEVRPGALTQINETFGRRFEIVNVRWLSADEI